MRTLYLAIISLCLFLSIDSNAQGRLYNYSGRARHNHFYHKVEFNYGNLYSFALSSCLTGVVNYLLDDAIFESGFCWPIYRKQEVSPYSFERQNVVGLQSNDLLHNIDCGIKLGYQTSDPGLLNFGICAVADYKYEPFMDSLQQDEVIQSFRSNIRRILLGGNIMLYLGKMAMGTQVILETGIRYSYGLTCNVPSSLGSTTSLNNGIVSHFAVSFGGPSYFQNIRIFADLTHFNLLESQNLRLSPIYVGLSWTVTPQQRVNKV